MGQIITTHRRLAAGLLILVVLVTACGSDDEPAETSERSTTSESITSRPDSTTTSTEVPSTTNETTATSSTTTSTTTDGSTSDPTSPTTGSTSPPASDTHRLLVDVRPVPITSVASVGPKTLEVTVEGGVDPCFIVSHIDLVETVDQVELTVMAGSEPDVVCIQVVELHTATIGLETPLGDRVVIDGTSGRQISGE